MICYGRGVTTYADNVTIIMSDEGQLPHDKIKGYEVVAGHKLTREDPSSYNSAPGGANQCFPKALWDIGWRSQLNCERFGPDLHLEKNWSDVTEKVEAITQV